MNEIERKSTLKDTTENTELANEEIALDLRLGRAIKSLRLQNGLTHKELAAASSTSGAMLQRIENGKVSASIETLANIADSFGMSLSVLFRELETPIGGAQHIAKGEGMEVVRTGTKKGHVYELLSYNQGPQKIFEPFLIKLDDASEVFPDFSHPGTEFIYMLEGKIEYHHGEKTYSLKPGDSLTFSGEIPHGPEKLVQVPIRFLAIIIYQDS